MVYIRRGFRHVAVLIASDRAARQISVIYARAARHILIEISAVNGVVFFVDVNNARVPAPELRQVFIQKLGVVSIGFGGKLAKLYLADEPLHAVTHETPIISVAARLRILIGFFIFPPYTFRFYPFKPEVIATPLRINFCEMRYKISSGNMLIPHAASF